MRTDKGSTPGKDQGDALPTLFIEFANAHGGDADTMHAMIERASAIGYADRVLKFQPFKYDRIALPDFEWYPVYEELFFAPDQWDDFIALAVEQSRVCLDLFDTYGCETFERNRELVSFLKFQPSVVENHEVFEALGEIDVVDTQLIINVSGLSFVDIDAVVDRVSALTERLALQIGFQAYPTDAEDLGLQKVEALRKRYPDLPLALADHSDPKTSFAMMAPLLGVAKGATMVEKHFCLSREDAKYDGSAALEPAEMTELGRNLTSLSASLSAPFCPENEAEYLRKSIQVPVLAADRTSGALLSPSDFLFRRTAQEGIKHSEIDALQRGGMVLGRSKNAFETLGKNDFRQASIVAIVAGRMKSSRLKEKALLEIGAYGSAARCLLQCAAASKVQDVILASSDNDEDAVLEKVARDANAHFWAGDPDDVIARYLGACEEHNVDIVVRVTADCPFVSPEIIDFLIDSHLSHGADYTAARDCAVGTSAEIINRSALQRVADHFGSADYSEYMTWYFQNNPEHFKLNIVELPEAWQSDARLTLDYPEDLAMMRALVEKLGPERCVYSLDEVLSTMRKHPDIEAKNAEMELRYRTDKELIDTLNRVTKM